MRGAAAVGGAAAIVAQAGPWWRAVALPATVVYGFLARVMIGACILAAQSVIMILPSELGT